MIIDFRNKTFPPGFRYDWHVYDAMTGEEIKQMIFFIDTEAGRIGRYATNPNGSIKIKADHTGAEEIWEDRLVTVGSLPVDEPITVG